jgi:hypothetical protein
MMQHNQQKLEASEREKKERERVERGEESQEEEQEETINKMLATGRGIFFYLIE